MDLRAVLGPAAAGAPPIEVRALAYDNRAVEPGTVFFCVPGFTRDGHDFAPDAVARGASALVVERPLGLPDVVEVVVPDVRAAMAPAAAALAGDPTRRLRTVGITGTNGKTTTALMVRALLEAAGHRTGVLGTVGTIVGGTTVPSARTTPEAIDLQRTFAQMLDAGDTHCVMEVSSHALDLRRADAIHWAAVAFTNLSQDHLDFHTDMEAYFRAKQRLFDQAQAQEPTAPMVVGADDPYAQRLPGRRVGLADAHDLRLELTRSTFTFGGRAVTVPLPGLFNVKNALVALALAEELGVDSTDLSATVVPGRMQPVDAGQPFAVLVDYAHTPDGLENVLRAAREMAGPDGGRVLSVFGAGGDRDRAKRPLMGAIAAELSDVAVVTSDNPRSEDPQAIIDEVAQDLDVRQVVDRREAIDHAIGLARAGDVVVIAGKGHEQGQEVAGGVKHPFDDVEVARDVLRLHGWYTS